MRKNIRILLILVVSLFFTSMNLKSQLFYDAGGIGAISLSKDLGRFTELSLEQELRFDRGLTSFNRSATSIGADFTLIKKLLKAQAGYDLLYRRNDEYYEFRHRAALGLVGEYQYANFTFKLRTRMQATFRDEHRGDYKFNPKFVWRNRLEVSYNIFGSPIRPYLSGEVFCPINSAHGFFMDSYRIVLGAKWRLSVRNSLNIYLRYDQDIQQVDPRNIVYGGVGWSYKFR